MIVISLISLTNAAPSWAIIGTHLGAGDIGHQATIMRNFLRPNGAEDGFPVTIMVDVGVSQSELQDLADAAKSNKLFPIIRINKSCKNQDPTSTINLIMSVFEGEFGFAKSDYVISFGNEVNHPEECGDWNQYAVNYRKIKNLSSNLSPSPIDFYMGIEQYSAANFFNQSGLSADYAAATTRTANAYGCIGESASSCDPENTTTQHTGMQGTEGKDLYLTEFSLSPGGASAPDTDLNNVIKFIETQGPRTNATHITPLVRNVCKGVRGDWLLYVHGTLITPNGEKVNPNRCIPIEGKEGADVYTPRDPENYNYYPLIFRPEQYLGEEKTLKNVLIWNLVRDQGYEVHCASKEWKIEKDVWGDIKRYYELKPNSTVQLTGDAEYSANIGSAKIPMLRGNEISSETQKISSLEGYFGSIEQQTNNEIIDNGVINSLLTVEQQCQLKLEKLKSIDEICQKLKNSGQCYLNQPIEGSDINEWGLLGEITDAYPRFDETICQDLAKNNSEIGVDEEKFTEIKQALNNMSLNMDNVYRLSFLVISVKQNPKSRDDDSFWFYQDAGNADKHAPIIIAFKIPDFGTNGSNSLAYRDTAHLTAQILRTEEQEEKAHLETEEKRDGFLQDIARRQEDVKQNVHIEDLVIDCRGMDECEKGGQEEVALKQALIDIINGSANSCVDVGAFEKAGDIFTYGNTVSDGREFKNNGGYADPFTKNFSTKENPEFEWGLTFNSESEARQAIEPELTIRAHVVVPVGADVEYINNALLAFFDRSFYEDMISNNCVADSGQCGVIPEYYTLQGVNLDLKSDRPDEKFDDPDDKECRKVNKEFPEGSGNYIEVEECGPKEKEFGVALKENNQGLYFPGASLGWHVRKIQETLHPLGSRAHSYITSCERTEDLFLGRCPGGDTTSNYYDDIVAAYEGGICDQIDRNSALFRECVICESKGAIWTGIGCIKTESQSIVETFVSIGLSVGGGFALMIILVSGFQLTVSQGDPKKIDDAKSRITAALVGLIFIIFSVVILQFIGVKILRIPGLGG